MSVFCRHLWRLGVVHRVFEESGRQVLEVADPGQAGAVRAAYDAWRAGRLPLEEPPTGQTASQPGQPPRWRQALARYPALSALLLIAVAVFPFSYPLAEGHLTDVAALLTIIDPRVPLDALPSVPELLARFEVWRWFTPMFLHFSVLHLGFNCAITVELGRRLERGIGSRGLVLVVAALSGSSNLIQYAFGSGPMFGGLSGVAYGLLGFVLTMNRWAPFEPEWQLPKGLSISLLLFLVVFTTGITEPFGLYVANAAHWGGFGVGILLAVGVRASVRAHRP